MLTRATRLRCCPVASIGLRSSVDSAKTMCVRVNDASGPRADQRLSAGAGGVRGVSELVNGVTHAGMLESSLSGPSTRPGAQQDLVGVEFTKYGA